jgi:hypothetical protein
MSFAPRADYTCQVAWARYVFGSFFTIGISTLDGPDVFAASSFSETFGGEHDDITGDVLSFQGRQGRQAGPGTDMSASEYGIELQDQYEGAGGVQKVGKYDRLNPDSPIADDLRPLRAVRITADYAGTTRPVLYGFLRSGESKPGPRKATAQLEVTDLFMWLADCHPVMMPTGPTTTGGVIGMMLDEIGWIEPTMRVLDVGDVIPDFEMDGSVTCLAAIGSVLTTEQGIFYIDKAGRAVYEDRHAWADKVSIGTVESALTRLGSGFSLDTIHNRALVTATGGDPQTALIQESIDEFGIRDFDSIESDLLTSDEQALSLAKYLVWRHGDIVSTLWELKIDNRTPELLDLLLDVNIQDRISVTDPRTSETRDYLVENIQGELIVQTSRHTLTMVLSEYPTLGGPFTIGVSTLDGPDVLVY